MQTKQTTAGPTQKPQGPSREWLAVLDFGVPSKQRPPERLSTKLLAGLANCMP